MGDDARSLIKGIYVITARCKDERLNHHGWSNKHIQASQEGLLSKISSLKEKIRHVFALQLSASARPAARLCDFSLIVTTWLRSQSLSSLNTCMHVNIWAITVPMCSAKGSSWSFCTLARLRRHRSDGAERRRCRGCQSVAQFPTNTHACTQHG